MVRVYRRQSLKGPGAGPGWAGPAFGDFFVEPFPLDFWKLEKSFAKTSGASFLAGPTHRKTFLRNVRNLIPRPFSPRYRYTYFTFIALLIVPTPTLSDSIATDAKRCSLIRRTWTLDDGLFIVTVVQKRRPRHSRSESPEILGRIVFFITAVGRSPPSVAVTAIEASL